VTALYATAGDNLQTRTVILRDTSGPIDLTNAASVAFHANGINVSATISKAATFIASTAGSVSVRLDTADLAAAGTYNCEWQVTFNDGTIMTVPEPGKDSLQISAQLA